MLGGLGCHYYRNNPGGMQCVVRPLLESNIVMEAIAGKVVCFAIVNFFLLVSCSIQLYNNMISLFTRCSGQ